MDTGLPETLKLTCRHLQCTSAPLQMLFALPGYVERPQPPPPGPWPSPSCTGLQQQLLHYLIACLQTAVI